MNTRKILWLVLALFFPILGYAKDFVVTEKYSHEISYKPSLQSRLSGVREVILFEPHNKTQNENYVISNLGYLLEQMGLRVNPVAAHYKVGQQQAGTVYAQYHLFDDDPLNYWQPINTLAFVINYVESTGYYTGSRLHIKVAVIDCLNNWQWNFDIDVPNKGDNLRKRFAQEIGTSWSYNSAYAFIPKSKKGNYDRFDIEQNFRDGNYNPFEGVYESNTYKVGMKKAVDGSYYLIYLESSESMSDWQIGDIKAELRESTTPGIFKGTWFGKWKQPMQHSFIFDTSSMITIDEDNNKETYIRMFPTATDISNVHPSGNNEWGGSGFALNNGYIVTNYHVVENAESIHVQGVNGSFSNKHKATVIATDKYNDIALLQISDDSFKGFGTIPYNIKTSVSDVGEEVFVLGYPLTSTMGDEIKLTNGIISSKTGFQGDVSLYQISAPIQPGNSGGPLFDSKGNLIGIINARHKGAENVSYAIKTSYLNNLIESSISTSILPNSNQIAGMPLTEKVKKLKNFVFMITCSNSASDNYTNPVNPSSPSTPSSPTSVKTVEHPTVTGTTAGRTKIKSVKLTKDYTAIEITSNNLNGNYYHEWCNIDKNTYILIRGTQYTLTRADGIEIAPGKTYYSYAGQDITFTLYFPPIPDTAISIDLIESAESEWKFYGIQLK